MSPAKAGARVLQFLDTSVLPSGDANFGSYFGKYLQSSPFQTVLHSHVSLFTRC